MIGPYTIRANDDPRTEYSKPWVVVREHDPSFRHLCGDLFLALDEADKLNEQHENETRLAAWEIEQAGMEAAL